MIKENSISSFRNSRCYLNPDCSKLRVTLAVQLLIQTKCHIDPESQRLDFLKKKHFILIDIEYQKLDIFLKFAQNSSIIDSSSVGENFINTQASLQNFINTESTLTLSPITLSLTNSLPHSPHCLSHCSSLSTNSYLR